MKMKNRVLWSILFIILFFLVTTIFHQYLVPTNADDLAISQVNNPDDSAILRMAEEGSNWIDPICGIGVMFILIGIWYKPIRTFCENEKG
jgi:hypothetical protein